MGTDEVTLLGYLRAVTVTFSIWCTFPVIVSLTASCAERETAHKKPIAQTIRTLVLLAIQSKQRLS